MRKMVLALLLSAGSVYGQDSLDNFYSEFDSAFMAEHGYVFYGDERDYGVKRLENLFIRWNGIFHELKGSPDEFSIYVAHAYDVVMFRDTLAINDTVTKVSLLFSEDNSWKEAIHVEYKNDGSEDFALFRVVE